MHVEPMKSQSCSMLALHGFNQKHGVPHAIKTETLERRQELNEWNTVVTCTQKRSTLHFILLGKTMMSME